MDIQMHLEKIEQLKKIIAMIRKATWRRDTALGDADLYGDSPYLAEITTHSRKMAVHWTEVVFRLERYYCAKVEILYNCPINAPLSDG